MSVRFALLGLLALQPRHGYDLRAAFEAIIGGAQNWDLKPAQVYTTLARLHEGGLVAQTATEQDAGPERRIYRITPAGEQALSEWFVGPVEGEHQRDEFYLKLMLSLANPRASPHEVIQHQRSALYRELHRVTELRALADPSQALAHVLLLDKAIMHLEADVRWLDMVEARLEEVRRQPLPAPEARPRGRPARISERGKSSDGSDQG